MLICSYGHQESCWRLMRFMRLDPRTPSWHVRGQRLYSHTTPARPVTTTFHSRFNTFLQLLLSMLSTHVACIVNGSGSESDAGQNPGQVSGLPATLGQAYPGTRNRFRPGTASAHTHDHSGISSPLVESYTMMPLIKGVHGYRRTSPLPSGRSAVPASTISP